MTEQNFFEDIITEVITFGDGSRIVIKVQTPVQKRQVVDTAHVIFYSLRDRLEAIRQYAVNQAKGGGVIERTR